MITIAFAEEGKAAQERIAKEIEKYLEDKNYRPIRVEVKDEGFVIDSYNTIDRIVTQDHRCNCFED